VTRIGIRNTDPDYSCSDGSKQQTEQQIEGEGKNQFAGQTIFPQFINKFQEPALKVNQLHTREEYEPEKTKDTTKKDRLTALNRCKSFLGLKTDNTRYKCLRPEEKINRRDKSTECSFVLKSTNENAKQRNRIKRSKSMDISNVIFLNNEKSQLIQKNSYPYGKRLEYVKKWQRDSFNEINQLERNEKPYSEMNDPSKITNESFYSLYFPSEQIQG
jgi:hypothetical protein